MIAPESFNVGVISQKPEVKSCLVLLSSVKVVCFEFFMGLTVEEIEQHPYPYFPFSPQAVLLLSLVICEV